MLTVCVMIIIKANDKLFISQAWQYDRLHVMGPTPFEGKPTSYRYMSEAYVTFTAFHIGGDHENIGKDMMNVIDFNY